MAEAAIDKIMTAANCSSEVASEILKNITDSADNCHTPLLILSLGIGARFGGLLLGGLGSVFAYKYIPAIKERLCSGNGAHPPAEMPRNDRPKNDDPENRYR